MHFNFDTQTVLWILTFAALLVLLVVLLGRDRVRRFPWFTTSIVLLALSSLASRLLYPRMPRVVSGEIFLTLSDLSAIVAVLVAVEIARRAFAGADRRQWITGTLGLLAVGGLVLAFWGPWPSFKTLTADSQLAALRFIDLFAQKTQLLANVLFIQLGVLVVIFGRFFKAGWHSHVQQLVIGLSMESIAQLAIRGTLQNIAMHTTIHSQDDYKRVVGLMNSLNGADNIILIVVLLWLIVCFWIDEPGAEDRGQGSGVRDQETDHSAQDQESENSI
jgi:hypothetical protein